MKKKLDAKDLVKYGLLFYNSLFMIIPALLFALSTCEMQKVSDFPAVLFALYTCEMQKLSALPAVLFSLYTG